MFEDKVILVTGASKGIGREISKALANEGSHLALVARNIEELDSLKEELVQKHPGRKVTVHPCDITLYEQVCSMVSTVHKEHGRINGIVSNAGYSYPQYFDKTPVDEFEKQIQTNYLGAVYLIKASRPFLKAGSFISFTSSVLGYMGCFGYSSYSPTKHALIGLAESLRQELSHEGVQISVLCPPDTLTPGYETENLTKPLETKLLSEATKEMATSEVAQAFLAGLRKKQFIINCNFESRLMYRLKMWLPEFFHSMVMLQLKKIRNNHVLSK